jgi:hypothetical protein
VKRERLQTLPCLPGIASGGILGLEIAHAAHFNSFIGTIQG